MFKKFLIVSLFFLVSGSLDVAISKYQIQKAKMIRSNVMSDNQ